MAGSKHQYWVKCAAGQQRCSKGDVTIVILRLHVFSLTDENTRKGVPVRKISSWEELEWHRTRFSSLSAKLDDASNS